MTAPLQNTTLSMVCMSSATPPLLPIAQSERIAILDILRGCALLGILLMNIECFVGPLDAGTTGIDPQLTGMDRIADALIYVLIQGKFYTLFSLLFGMGFAVMSKRAADVGRAFMPFYLRRSLGLLTIGLIHAVLIWSGDILVLYALMSLPLLMSRRLPTAALPLTGLLLYLIPVALMSIYCWADFIVSTSSNSANIKSWQEVLAQNGTETAQVIREQRHAYGAGSYVQATVQRLHDVKNGLESLIINGVHVLGMFLLGTWFVRSGAILQPERYTRLFAWLRWGAWPLGLTAMLLSVHLASWQDVTRVDPRAFSAFALSMIAGLLMCLGYLAWGIRAAFALTWAAPAGRMALSNYLLQSMVCTLIFYGYGLGFFERLPRVWQLPFAIALFTFQVALSRWWLQRFRFGPCEWLWRSFTYLRWEPLRVASTAR
ncbi:membrane protein [Xylella fastidiosa subsp. sandyi Ann-1]|uniref:Membrane protein n=2 Tax=Xylella fastidiosa TaxID=2371 RepID=A0A060HCD9_XYLFS|nr:membrane protein [Xylella fastidiosa subsp. sandyi Ann-1]KQH73689.1 hypothetical protein AOT81_06720 [Xylella fastidiosa]RWA44702.1 DUF418 domain-containing protein [Xylella fastidiosa subsp. sandyi]